MSHIHYKRGETGKQAPLCSSTSFSICGLPDDADNSGVPSQAEERMKRSQHPLREGTSLPEGEQNSGGKGLDRERRRRMSEKGAKRGRRKRTKRKEETGQRKKEEEFSQEGIKREET